ncbi:MAG: protein kinase [Myxococcales bacterium]|nr:protein kinase [Myxococcales bacterium]
MGEVWLGWHRHTESLAAVKLLKEHPALRGRARRFFDRERRVIGRLSHPNVISLYEVGPDHIAMAYVDGPNLAERVMNGIEPALALSYTLQIASALAHAHGLGVVHRDVKPGNILLDSLGNAFLGDFGLATLAGESLDGSTLRAGTPGYMAPEQVRGVGVGPLADQFALGRTLLEMLAGGPVSPHLEQALAQLPDAVPESLRSIVRRACATDPQERFPDMAELGEALSRVQFRGSAPPVRLAPELRVRAPFAWCSGATRVERVSHDVARADYELSEVARAGLVPASAATALLAQAGLTKLGFSMYAHESRLGQIADSMVLARASDIVVLVHGTFCSRAVWSVVASNLCRNHPQVVVLVPDVLGSGESTFDPGAPDACFSTQGLVDLLQRWLDLLGVRELPTVLAGHSAAATALLGVADEHLGERTSRVAVTPVFPSTRWHLRWALSFAASTLAVLGRFAALRRWVGRLVFLNGPAMRAYKPSERERMLEQFLRIPAGPLAAFCRSLAAARPERGDRLDRCAIVVAKDDPVAPERQVLETLDGLGFPRRSVHKVSGPGHAPHLEHADHPEWTLRAFDELARITELMLMSAREGSPSSTVMASTVIASSDASDGASRPEATAEIRVTT